MRQAAGRCPGREAQSEEGKLVREDDSEEGPVNRQAVFVVKSVPRLHSRGIGTLPIRE